MSVGELFKSEKYLDAMELALYTKLLDKIDADDWDGAHQVVGLLDALSII